jgi:fatty-acyl-CoA synthase
LRQLSGEPTLADCLARWARERPEALALEVAGERLSYRELASASQAAAERLAELGARAGDTVALVGKNSIGYVAALLGGAASGVTLALVHPELTAEPLRGALSAARARFILGETPLLASLREATSLPLSTFDPTARAPFGDAAAPLTLAPERASSDLALVFTSGTTGSPKACRLPHSRVVAAACLFGAPLFDFRATDKLLCVLPLHHGSPLMLGLGSCLITGTPLALERRFSASELVSVAQRTGATALLYVGDLGRLLLSTPASARDREHALRLAVGNGMAAEVWERFQERFGVKEVREFYAATESPVGIFNLSGRVGSVGNLPYRWLFGLELVRLDAEGEPLRDENGRLVRCSVNEPGELLVRARRSGLGVYHGYVDGSATEARLVRGAFRDGDAWFRTHDVLRRDREGFYYFVERGGDSYRFRGENVAVATVEEELRRIAGVQEALVTGLRVPGYDGGVGLAVLVTAASFDVHALESLKEKLPRTALPRFVRVVAALARTSSLKLKRRVWAQDGVDPERVADPLWVLAEGRYLPLSRELYGDVLTGKLRL